MDIESNQIIDEFHRLADWSVSNVVPLLLLLVGFTILFNLVQVGFLLAPDVIRPILSRINPFDGIKRILSVSSLFTVGFGVAKLLVCVLVAVWFFTQQLPLLVNLINTNTASIAAYIGQTASKFAFLLALTYLGLALLDFSFRRWKYEQDLRMTKREIREELKSMEGDPQIRQRRRETHQKLIQARQSH